MNPSSPSLDLLEKIKESSKYCRDDSLRRKLDLFLKAHRTGNILKTCREAGKGTNYYYLWWNRYRNAGYSVEALKEISRRPKRSPKAIDPKVGEWIKHYRKEFGYGLEKIQSRLEGDHRLRLSRSTIYRVLRRENLFLRKRKKKNPERKKNRDREILGGRYLLEEELGRGGTGLVYKAKDLNSGERLALKRVPLRRGGGATRIAAIRNEFLTLIALRHPHLARVFDFGGTEREIYFTSEFIDGEDFLKSGERADLNTVFQWIVQMLRGLDFLHRRGILHLDLKPENVLVGDPEKSGNPAVKLIDFGSAEWKRRGILHSGEVSGTPPYTAPEILQGRPPTPASDLYSVGILLCRLFGGRFPFRSQDPVDILKEQVYGDPEEMENLHPGLPEDFSKILLRLTAKDPERRFPSARELLEAINLCLDEDFSLRSSSAPVRFLEESDMRFREDLRAELVQICLRETGGVVLLSSPPFGGKSRLIEETKAALQLKGRFPFHLKREETLNALLQTREIPPCLLIDFEDESRVDWMALLGRLENLGVPVLAATGRKPSPELNPSRWIELKKLSPGEIIGFFRHEIAGFPKHWENALASLAEGSFLKIEEISQALRDEGLIQWSLEGWQWVEGEISPEELKPRHLSRWEGRRRQLADLLRFFPSGMDAETLCGLLNLEKGGLDLKLAEWTEAGIFRRENFQGSELYSLPAAQEEEKNIPPSQDWEGLFKTLSELYERGEFSAGLRLADLLFLRNEDLPPALRLLCARLSVAEGEAAKALERLPREISGREGEWGLHREIRARALLLMGKMEEAPEALQNAEEAFVSVQDKAGLSRLFNLRGSFHKIAGEFEKAERFFKLSASYASECGESYLEGLARMNLGTLYHDRGSYASAERTYAQAFELEKRAAHPVFSCKLRHNWVNLLFHTGRLQEAESVSYEWLSLSLKHRYPDQQAAAFNYLALIAGREDRKETQKNYLSRSLYLLEPSRFPTLYFQTLLNRASVNLDLRKYTAAELDAERSLKVAEKLVPSFSALAHLLLGRIFRDRPRADLVQAGSSLNTAHAIIWKHQYRQLLWEVEFERGLTAKKKKEFERARNYFLAAQNYLESFLQGLPEEARQGYLRDRRWEQIEKELLLTAAQRR